MRTYITSLLKNNIIFYAIKIGLISCVLIMLAIQNHLLLYNYSYAEQVKKGIGKIGYNYSIITAFEKLEDIPEDNISKNIIQEIKMIKDIELYYLLNKYEDNLIVINNAYAKRLGLVDSSNKELKTNCIYLNSKDNTNDGYRMIGENKHQVCGKLKKDKINLIRGEVNTQEVSFFIVDNFYERINEYDIPQIFNNDDLFFILNEDLQLGADELKIRVNQIRENIQQIFNKYNENVTIGLGNNSAAYSSMDKYNKTDIQYSKTITLALAAQLLVLIVLLTDYFKYKVGRLNAIASLLGKSKFKQFICLTGIECIVIIVSITISKVLIQSLDILLTNSIITFVTIILILIQIVLNVYLVGSNSSDNIKEILSERKV